MPVTVSTNCQSRWKDCCAPSSKVGLTLVSNGEEPVQVYTQARTMVPAGIDAPTVAPVITDGGSGLLPAGNVVYLYVYASSAYPNVEADTAAGGNLWPKGQPSPVSAVYANAANKKINVTVATSQRSDIDKILIYRTAITTGTPPDYDSIVATAGQAFYVGFVQNNSAAATVTFTDNVVAGVEELEVDNFPAPQFWLCCYIDPYWYGIGNPDLNVPVTIDATGNLTATYNAFYPGRNGQLVTFDGITTGGFDGNGTFYFKYQSPTVANVSVLADYSVATFPGYNGTTVMRIRGYAGTLYRSKARNPFAWGYTEIQTAGDDIERVTQTFAQVIGGYAVAMSVMPQQRQLKIDCERPPRSYAIDVSVDLTSQFQAALRLLDARFIVTSHHSQFLSLLANGQTALRGIDSSNFAIVQSDSGGQAPISDNVCKTLRTMVTNGDSARLFHGVYDTNTELSAFWFKQSIDPNNYITIDSCLLYHGPSGQWSFLRDLDITSSASVYDPETLQTLTLVGTASGQICQAFAPNVFWNIHNDSPNLPGVVVNDLPGKEVYTVTIAFPTTHLRLSYFDIPYSQSRTVRFYFQFDTPYTPPATPPGGFLVRVPYNGGFPTGAASALKQSLVEFGFQNVILLSNAVTFTAINGGKLPPPSAGTAPLTISVQEPASTLGTSSFGLSSAFAAPIGSSPTYGNTWVLFFDPSGQNEKWGRYQGPEYYSNSKGEQKFGGAFDLFFDPVTLSVSDSPDGYAPYGHTVFDGVINTEALTYFQPSETESTQRREMWLNQSNVSVAQWVRLYSEWDNVATGAPVKPSQSLRSDRVSSSNNWVCSSLPSTLVPQFGVRIIERGYSDFTLRSFTLKGQ